MAEVLGRLNNISDPLLQNFRLREATVFLAIPYLRAPNSDTKHSTTGSLGWNKSNAAKLPIVLFLGAAKCAQQSAAE